jgi:amino acid adenylation domain-containing protein
MTAIKFLSDLNNLGIKIWIEDEQLRYRAPQGVMSSDLKQKLLERKSEILAFFKEIKTNIQSTPGSILPVSRSGELPLSFAQQRMWFLNQLDSQNAFYNEGLQVQIRGALNISVLEESINEIIHRHESLRTTFPTVDGKPVQRISPSLTINLPLVDLQGLPPAGVQQFITKEVRQSFDLDEGPLSRFMLLRCEPETHILIVTMHHIITDGWSMGILMKELSTLYQAFSVGTGSHLTELPIQYADFTVWQRQRLTGEVWENQLNYWKQQLAGATPLLELPTDKPRPPVQTFRGAVQEFQLDLNLTTQLKTLSRESGSTLFHTILAAYVILLYRYSGQDDISVGCPMANRNRTEIESLIGFFVNTIVLRNQIQGNPSFSEFLTQVRQVALAGDAHQDIPFEQVVDALQPERSLSYSSLFQVMFAWQSFSLDTLELSDISLTTQMVERETSAFDLNLSIWETKKGLMGRWEYSTDLFADDTIARMTGHFQTLLSGIIAHPDQSISKLPLLTAKEQEQILVGWNQTETDYPKDKCIHELFEERVKVNPDAIALIYDNQQLTYRELNARANQLAHYLQSLGVKSEVLVGICVERSLEMIVGILAILKAGGAYVPLDPEYPEDRLTFMLEDTQLSVLLTQDKLVNKLPDHKACVICLDTNWDIINQQTEENPNTSIKADNLAYVMYTSGSTGQPKGVSIVHQGVVRLVTETDYVSFSAKEVFLQVAPISFDAATFEIWGCLLNSGKLVIFPSNTPSLDELGQVIEQYQVTTLWLTAGLFHLMVDENIEALKPLRQLLTGGDVLSVSHVHKFLQTVGNCQLINGYGPTENTTFTCCYQIPTSLSPDVSVPIGRPIANTQVYILDKNLQPVPVGVPGELYTGGAGLARGYLNRPELTQEKFIPNPFSTDPDSRLYKTGDKVRYLSDGNIEYQGRIDNQVKIRGFRIELGEIETVLSQHADVHSVVVITRQDTPDNKRLVAYIVPHPQVTPTTRELHQFLKAKLPDYMVPNAFVILEALPLTPNGKVDRRALPAPDVINDTETFVAASTPTEKAIATIWGDVLGLKQVGIHDNFFELGGHSLLATQVISRLRQTWKMKLPLRRLFEKPTVAELAQTIDKILSTVQKLQSNTSSDLLNNREEIEL